MKKQHIIHILFAMLLISSCRTLNTNLSVSEQKLPTSYTANASDTTIIARMNWKQYFSDTLLVGLIDTALVNNFDLQIALQHIEIAHSGVRFSTGELFPKLNGNISVGLDKYAKYTPDYAGNSTTPLPNDATKVLPNPLPDFFIGLSTTWEIDIWGKLRNQRKAALSNYLSSVEGKNFVVSNLVAAISISYYELLALDNQLEIVKQTIQKQQEAFEVVKIQKEAGKINQLAVQQFHAQLINSQVLEEEILQQIIETENKINFLLGRFPQAIVRNKQSLFQEIPIQIASGIPSQMLSHRPDIREAEYQVQASKFDLKSAKAAFFPNINLSTVLGFQAFNPQFLFSSPASIGYSVLGGLVAPLLNMNGLKAQFSTAKANQLMALYNYQKTILNGYIEVVNELSTIQSLREINRLKTEQNEVLINAVEISTDLYKTSKANYVEVLLAQQNSLQAKLELIEINKRQCISTVNIYKALGGGW